MGVEIESMKNKMERKGPYSEGWCVKTLRADSGRVREVRRSDHSGFKAIGKTHRETRMMGLVARRQEMIKETLEVYSYILDGKI